jgi:hypothetical protein
MNDTFGYHIINLSIHISTFAFYLLIARYVDNNKDYRYRAIAILAALLFLLHP